MSEAIALNDRQPVAPYAVITPIAVLMVFLLVALLPWGLPGEARFVLPMLPYVAIHYWTLNDRGFMPAGLVFVVGLVIDLVTRGPLGFWAMIFLTGQMCALWLSGAPGDTRLKRWLGFFAVIGLLSCLQWLVASIYFVAWADPRPFATAAVVIAAIYPLFSLALIRRFAEKPL